jgi:histidine ammonia-lyase
MKLTADQFNSIVERIRSDQDWFEPFIQLAKDYYAADYGAGRNLHIVLDEGNLEDSNVNWCAGYACGVGDDEASDIANLMLHMTIRQRELVYSNDLLYAL